MGNARNLPVRQTHGAANFLAMRHDFGVGTGGGGSEIKYPFLKRLRDKLLETAMQLPTALAFWQYTQAVADFCQCHRGDE